MTTLFLATTGGHLDQLDDLAARIRPDGSSVWVTHANEQSRSLLSGRSVEFVPYVRVRNVGDVARCIPTAHRIWRKRGITRAVSTGSGIALGYLPYLAARGVECHYIESAARVTAPSLTGRLLQWMPTIHRYTQYPQWAGRRWTYTGSVFDSFRPTMIPHRPAGVVRVVVTVGTAREFPFDRLIAHLVPLLAEDGELAVATGLPVDVLWQTGCTPTGGLPISATPYVGADELARALATADIIISHAGAGSVLGAFVAGRRPLLASRSKLLGEAGDDHQTELAKEIQRRRLGIRRDASNITVDDLLATLDSGVGRSSNPPAFELRP